jgi:hypothetical protein
MTKNCPSDKTPSLVRREYGDVDRLMDVVPLTSLSIMSKFVLAVVPQVPDNSPVAGFAMPPLLV